MVNTIVSLLQAYLANLGYQAVNASIRVTLGSSHSVTMTPTYDIFAQFSDRHVCLALQVMETHNIGIRSYNILHIANGAYSLLLQVAFCIEPVSVRPADEVKSVK